MIVDQPQLGVLEVDLFKACVDWATRQLRRNHTDTTVDGFALRQTLDRILPSIRFPTMSLEQFSASVVPLGILTTDETCELYKYLTCPVKPDSKFNTASRCINISTLVTLSTRYKLKTVSGDSHVVQCHGNVNKPVRLHELRFITSEVTDVTKLVVEIKTVKLEQDRRATEFSFLLKAKTTENTAKDDDDEIGLGIFATRPKTEKIKRPQKAFLLGDRRRNTTMPLRSFSPMQFPVAVNEDVDFEQAVLPVETKRVEVKSDNWTWSTLTSEDGKVYKVVHVRWDGEELLLDEGDFTLNYGFNVSTEAAREENVARPVFRFAAVSARVVDQLLYIRRLDQKRFELNDVAFTVNFPSGPLVAFAFCRL